MCHQHTPHERTNHCHNHCPLPPIHSADLKPTTGSLIAAHPPPHLKTRLASLVASVSVCYLWRLSQSLTATVFAVTVVVTCHSPQSFRERVRKFVHSLALKARLAPLADRAADARRRHGATRGGGHGVRVFGGHTGHTVILTWDWSLEVGDECDECDEDK